LKRSKRQQVLNNITVEAYAAEGKSIARVDGKVIFIEDAVPGDVVDLRITRDKKDWAEGKALTHHQFSPNRVTPFCEHFGVCGGCQWQMLPYALQLDYKQQQVAETLRRIGKLPLPPIQPILGANPDRRYRNKIEYTFSNREYILPQFLNDPEVSNRQSVAGFHARGLFDKIVDIRECHLQVEPTNQIRLAASEFALRNKFSFYDIKAHEGFMRTLQLRICKSGEIMVNMVFGENRQDDIMLLMTHLSEKFPEITTLLYTINQKKNDSLHDLNPIVFKGKGFVVELLEDYQFKIGPKSFFQTNSYQGEELYKVTRDFAMLTGNDVVYDLYCGTGSIGIFLSKGAAKIVGIEMIPEAVRDAEENAQLNGLSNALFLAGDAANICNNDLFTREGRPDVIVTDPPRAGMHADLVRTINETEAARVVYVSCNVATQARDLNLLSDKYEVVRVQPVDMFPHTHHIENVVQLRLK
jgi:23S rRNA (uracil1939-C5)-methyltransferase